ncbi:MAG: hypothetical protein JNM49_08755 [Flavobacteriales bacterium]|jgi:hypothetical protein|nr:hypothetical protein [Flavobacteriales bacterium]
MPITSLPDDWAFAPALDAELKRYQLLAYIQHVEASFASLKLYPHISDLDNRVSGLERLRADMGRMQQALGSTIRGFDPATGQVLREPLATDPWLAIVEEVIDTGLPALRSALAEGRALLDEVGSSIKFGAVGLLPLTLNAGWLLLRQGRQACAYTFELPAVSSSTSSDARAQVRTRYVTTFTMGIALTFERIKGELVCSHPELPNPAVFAFETELGLPRIETYMPVAKRLLYEVINAPR